MIAPKVTSSKMLSDHLNLHIRYSSTDLFSANISPFREGETPGIHQVI